MDLHNPRAHWLAESGHVTRIGAANTEWQNHANCKVKKSVNYWNKVLVVSYNMLKLFWYTFKTHLVGE